MPSNAKIAAIAVILVAAVYFLFQMGKSDDEQQVSALLDKLENLGSKSPHETQIETLGTARKLAACFVEQPYLRVPHFSQASSRKELTGAMAGMRSQVPEADVSLSSRVIKISEDGRTASVNFIGTADVNTRGGSEYSRQPYHMKLVKVDGEWLIAEVTVLED